jgi:hypothetical protein
MTVRPCHPQVLLLLNAICHTSSVSAMCLHYVHTVTLLGSACTDGSTQVQCGVTAGCLVAVPNLEWQLDVCRRGGGGGSMRPDGVCMVYDCPIVPGQRIILPLQSTCALSA